MAGSRQPQNYEIFTGESQSMVVRHGFFERHDDVLEDTPRAARPHGSAPDSVLRKLLGYEEAEPEHEPEGPASSGMKGRASPSHQELVALAALSPAARRTTPPGLKVPLPALLGKSGLSPGGCKDGSPLPVKYTFIHLPEGEEEQPQQRRHTWCSVRPGEDSASNGTETGSAASASPTPAYGMELGEGRRRSRPSRLLEFVAVEDMREGANESEESDDDEEEDEEEDEAEDSSPLAAWSQRPRASVTATLPQMTSSPASWKNFHSPGNTPTGSAGNVALRSPSHEQPPMLMEPRAADTEIGHFINLPQPSCPPTAPSPCSPPLASPTPFAQHPAAAMTNPVLPHVAAMTAPSQQGIWSTPVNPGMPLSMVQAMNAQGASSQISPEQLAQLAPMAMAQALHPAAAAAAAASCPLNNPLAAWAAAASFWAAAYSNPWLSAQQSPASLMAAAAAAGAMQGAPPASLAGFPGAAAGAMHAGAAQAPVAAGFPGTAPGAMHARAAQAPVAAGFPGTAPGSMHACAAQAPVAAGFPGTAPGAMHACAAQAPVAAGFPGAAAGARHAGTAPTVPGALAGARPPAPAPTAAVAAEVQQPTSGMESRRRMAPAPAPAPVLLPAGLVPPAAPQALQSAAVAVEQPAPAETTGTGAVAASSKKSKGRSRRARLWAHIYLHMQDAPGEFDLVSRIIGRGGCNMRRIAETTGAKIRVRGRGSGHLEVDGRAEAPTPLMVAVTTDHQENEGFKSAVQQTLDVLEAVATRFDSHCRRLRHTHEGPHYSIGLLPPNAKEILGEVLEGVPQSGLALQAEQQAQMNGHQ